MRVLKNMFFNIIDSAKRSGEQMVRTIDPRTKEELWDVPIANEIDLNDAVAAARRAFLSWKSVPIEARRECLLKLAEETEKRKDEIRYVLAKECGKSDLLAAMEIDDSLKFIRFNASQSLPDEVQYEDSELKIISSHHPLGVVAAICPWNFPLVLAVAKIAAALVTGNCIIVKPSPFSPYTTLKFVEIAMSIVPPGVLQALNGDNDIGKLMTLHPGIDKISFTGSTATGKRVAESASRSLKRLTLELGGNDASIIFPDVDVQSVASKVASGCFFHSGQMCVATKRVYIHRDIFLEFQQAFVNAVSAIAVDTPRQSPSTFSPIQNEMQFDIVKGLISDCKEKGYSLIYDGGCTTDGEEPGFYIRPVVVDRPPDNSKIVQAEQFGPIIPLCEWTSEDEVITRVNEADSGLGACVWSGDVSIAQRVARNLEVGTVWINCFPIPNPYGYFSGWKQSGMGGEWGKQGLLSYCHTQTVQLYKQQVTRDPKRA